jgi:hypothetical protein
LECVEYDHHFQQDLAAKFKVWDTPDAHAQRAKRKEAKRGQTESGEAKGKERNAGEKAAAGSTGKKTKTQGSRGVEGEPDISLAEQMDGTSGPPHRKMRRLWKATAEPRVPCVTQGDKDEGSSSELTEYNYGDSDGEI